MSPRKRTRLAPLLVGLLLFLASVILVTARTALAEGSPRTVRVGWFESPFNTTDERGRRSGYSYEYQQKIAASAGWTYEYVTGSWPELMQMLQDGKIDLLSDVSFTEERAESMLFSALPMGEENYYVFVSPNNTSISSDDYATFNGKRVGVNKGSVQADIFRTWAEANDVTVEVVELAGTEDDNLEALQKGEVDMYVALDFFSEERSAIPLCKIGSSDFFFAVSKSKPELLTELNAAMNHIQDENLFYNQELYAKYLKTAGTNLYLSSEERAWLEAHGAIRMGYVDDFMAFCATDPATGELTGALKEYVTAAFSCLDDVRLDFEPVAYPTVAKALEALGRGEVDCVFPASLTAYDGEVQDLFLTSPVMSTDVLTVVRKEDQKNFAKKERVAVAVDAGNTNYDLLLLDHFPDWRAIYFANTQECLQAVADERADCVLVGNYQYNSIAAQCEASNLVTFSNHVEADYSIAVNRSDTTLYAILNKVNSLVPRSSIDAALINYYAQDDSANSPNTARNNLYLATGVFIAVPVLVVGSLLLISRHRSNR